MRYNHKDFLAHKSGGWARWDNLALLYVFVILLLGPVDQPGHILSSLQQEWQRAGLTLQVFFKQEQSYNIPRVIYMAKAKSQGGRKSTRLLWRWDGERKQIYLICNLPQKASLKISNLNKDLMELRKRAMLTLKEEHFLAIVTPKSKYKELEHI